MLLENKNARNVHIWKNNGNNENSKLWNYITVSYKNWLYIKEIKRLKEKTKVNKKKTKEGGKN